MRVELRSAFLAQLAKEDWQLPAGSLADEVWDVLVIGAGPAGSVAAIHLASNGHRVLLIDEKRFPREKVCGDALCADALTCLERVGLAREAREMSHELSELLLFSRSGVEVKLHGDFLTLERSVLDSLLARRAVASGAVFACGTVEDLHVESDGSVTCIVSKSKATFRARVGVLATGARVHLARKLGLVVRNKPSGLALRCILRSSRQLRHHVIWCDAAVVPSTRPSRVPGFAWIFPIGDDNYNIGCGILCRNLDGDHARLSERLDRFITRFTVARELVRHGELLSPPRSGVVRSGLKGTQPLGKGNVLVVGETIGVTLPFSGTGIGKAMETAEIAGSVIHAALESGAMGVLRKFPIRLERRLRRSYRRYGFAEALFSRSWFNDCALRLARRSSFLRRLLVDMLAGGRDSRHHSVLH